MANDLPPTVILAIPGTQETKEMPRAELIEAIRKGEIPQDNWVWSPAHNDWKQVAELPELNVPAAPMTPTTPPPAPVQSSVLMGGKIPTAGVSFPVAGTPVAKAATPVVQKVATQPHQESVASRTPTGPVVVAAAAPVPSAHAAAKTKFSQKMEVKHEFPIFKVLFVVIFLLVAGIVAINYLYVDSPFTQNMAQTPYANVQPYAHLGAFIQPGALVIHVPPTTELNANNMANFLVTLARNTPSRPFSSSTFDGVGLTSAWQSQYLFNGADWATLGEMIKDSPEARKKFELEHLQFLDGSPIVKVKKNEDPAAIAEAQEKAWQEFVSNFQPKQ